MEKNRKIQILGRIMNKNSFLIRVFIVLTAIILSIPLYIILYSYMPEIKISVNSNVHFRVDHILVFILVFLCVWFLVRLLRVFIMILALLTLLILSINFFLDAYSYDDIYTDYKSLVFYLIHEPVKVPFIPESASFRNAKSIKKAIDYQDTKVRNYAVGISVEHFNDLRYEQRLKKVLRYFSIFKVINNKWNYVSDPSNEEYYAAASETIDHLSGDCDDYAIVMAACIKAVGGEARLVRTEGHLYPEVLVCSSRDFEIINLLIRELFEKETEAKLIYFHEDKNGNIWLNFDYTDRYPGGEFMNERIINILYI
jgi:hypothetical protein